MQDIVDYLDSAPSVLFPNSLILALSGTARFVRSRGPATQAGGVAAGTLELQLPAEGQPRPAWIVDGQQRALALSKSRRADLPVPISAFVADDIGIQRDQFLRVNNTKPLPRGLITELLPEITCPLPARLAARQIPAALADQLARHDDSPFKGLVRRSSDPPGGRGKRPAPVAEQSLVKMLADSLNTPAGCLFPFRNAATKETDFNGVWAVLVTFWSAVKETFPEAWGLPPTQSRLMHSVGIQSMGRLMDRVMATVNVAEPAAARQARRSLELIRPACRWTTGNWEDLGGIAWNSLENTHRQIHLLSNYLVRLYVRQKDGATQ